MVEHTESKKPELKEQRVEYWLSGAGREIEEILLKGTNWHVKDE